jgi:hypothetical protein
MSDLDSSEPEQRPCSPLNLASNNKKGMMMGSSSSVVLCDGKSNLVMMLRPEDVNSDCDSDSDGGGSNSEVRGHLLHGGVGSVDDEGTGGASAAAVLPLDLSCPSKRPSYEAMVMAAALFQQQQEEHRRRRRLYEEEDMEDMMEMEGDSDDSEGQPIDLGLNPKAYKKSLMKRYRKHI